MNPLVPTTTETVLMIVATLVLIAGLIAVLRWAVPSLLLRRRRSSTRHGKGRSEGSDTR